MRILLCFDDLSTCRGPGGFAYTPVPYTAVLIWARHHQMTFSQTNRLWTVIKLIDSMIRMKIKVDSHMAGRP